MTDFQLALLQMDEECHFHLSQAKYLKDKRAWAKADFQQQSLCVRADWVFAGYRGMVAFLEKS